MDIMYDVVDQAQFVHHDCHNDVGSELKGQKRLMKRLIRMGYQVEDEVQLTTRVLKESKVERNRVDLLINRKVLVELKHANDIVQAHSQVKRYMNHPNMAKICDHAVLIGFPKKRMDIHLVICHSAVRAKGLTGIVDIQFDQASMRPTQLS